MKIHFTAAVTFFSPETGSEYVKGLSYSASAGDKVFSLITRWIEEGKIALGGNVAQVTGTGEANGGNASNGNP